MKNAKRFTFILFQVASPDKLQDDQLEHGSRNPYRFSFDGETPWSERADFYNATATGTTVAQSDHEACEQIYAETQHGGYAYSPWDSLDRERQFDTDFGWINEKPRSTSKGDVIFLLHNQTYYEVKDFGFAEISAKPEA